MAVACILIVATLGLPSAAFATHSDYWFFNGYLPRPDGTYTKHHADPPDPFGSNPDSFVIRMSWSVDTHNMRFIAIRNNGSWDGFWAQEFHDSWDYDQEARFPDDMYTRGGCQNHPDWNWWTVWTNCHIRNFP
jgi:hypothetical protein